MNLIRTLITLIAFLFLDFTLGHCLPLHQGRASRMDYVTLTQEDEQDGAAEADLLDLLLSERQGQAAGMDYISSMEGEQDWAADADLPDNLLSEQASDIGTVGQGREDGGDSSASSAAAGTVTGEEEKTLDTVRNSLHENADSDDSDIPLVLNEAVNRHIKCFTTTKRNIFARWLKRAERYAPVIRKILRRNDLPEDLVYLAMIESGFNMKAYSRAKASGPWQFIHETGERYGLKVDYWVDERRDLEKSTVAAARYLKDLFDQFGCWYLAAAGYNAGEKRVERAIVKYDTKDFWKLRRYRTLPRETQEYVPQLIAAAVIAKNPEKYGFTEIESPPVYNLTKISVPGGIALRGIAHVLSLDPAELKSLNPHILRGITPPDRKEYQVKLPETPDVESAIKRLEAGLRTGRRVVGMIKHYVKKRESLQTLLKRYDISRSDLALFNGDGRTLRIQKGRLLNIPRFAVDKGVKVTAAGTQGPPDSTGVTMTGESKGDNREILTENGGDDDVVVLNEVKRPKRHRAGLRAKAVLTSETVRRVEPTHYYRVQKGDSLVSISKRHHLGISRLKKINGLKGSGITAGQRLKVR